MGCPGSAILWFLPEHRQLALLTGFAVASGSFSAGGFPAHDSSGSQTPLAQKLAQPHPIRRHHAISLAHFSLTFARSVAANSINARIRLKAENSRLRQEIALLIEEARIKDSRMDRIPAQRRPHYRRSNAWRSSSSEQHAAGPCLRRLADSSSLRRQSPPGCSAWTKVIRKARAAPKYLITDHGKQFASDSFKRWCRRRSIRQRFGAVGTYGSLAVIERLIRSIKDECTRRLIIPYRRDAFRRELLLFLSWYNGHRPHTRLDVRTPDEIYFGERPACLMPRFEPRRRWPRRSRCAGPQATIRGRRGVRLELQVSHLAGRKHLPIVELKRAA